MDDPIYSQNPHPTVIFVRHMQSSFTHLDFCTTMSISMAALSVSRIAFLSHLFATDVTPYSVSALNFNSPNFFCRNSSTRKPSFCTPTRVSLSGDSAAKTEGVEHLEDEGLRQPRRSADWKAARAYYESGLIYEGRVEGFNGGGLLIQFYSLVGFLPFPQLSPSHSCKGMAKIRHTARKQVAPPHVVNDRIQKNEIRRLRERLEEVIRQKTILENENRELRESMTRFREFLRGGLEAMDDARQVDPQPSEGSVDKPDDEVEEDEDPSEPPSV